LPFQLFQFFYSRGANCCAEIRALLECDPVGPCRGFEGDCADIQAQFETVQGPYMYGMPPEEHLYLDEYVCHAFPDDAYVTDQIFVGLISVAVALPVDIFLAKAFELANEGDEPGNWLEAPPGRWKLLMGGKNPHNDWHLADPKKPVSDLALWLVADGGEDTIVTIIRMVLWFIAGARARLFGAPKEDGEEDKMDVGKGGPEASASGSSTGSAAARSDALKKRLFASAGLLGVYVTWTIMAWCVWARPCAAVQLLTPLRRCACARQVHLYLWQCVPRCAALFVRMCSADWRGCVRRAVLIYKQLGSKAQSEFAQTWGGACAWRCFLFLFSPLTLLPVRTHSWLRAQQCERVPGRGHHCGKGCAADRHPGCSARQQELVVVRRVRRPSRACAMQPLHAACADAGALAQARGLCEHAGGAVQRRRQELVGADAHAGEAAVTADGGLTTATRPQTHTHEHFLFTNQTAFA
jgi:hypothetical protein